MCNYCERECECECPEDRVSSLNHCTACGCYFKGTPKDWESGI